jgi:ATP-binding cassette, subfamily B, bacterial
MKQNTGTGRQYWRLLSPFRWSIASILALGIFAAGVSLLQPYLFHYAIDEIALKASLPTGQRITRLTNVALLMGLLIALSFVASYFNAYCSTALSHRVTARLRYRLLRHMLRLPLHELTKMKTGGATARLNQDTNTASSIVNKGIITPGVALFQGVVALTMVFVLNWKMSLAALVVILPLGVVTHLFTKRLRPLFKEIAAIGGELSARSIEMFGGVRVSRIYCREVAERRAYVKFYHQIIRKTLAARRKQIAVDSLWLVAFGLIQIVIVLLGIYLSIYHEATVGDIIAIIIYSNRLMGPIEQVVSSYDGVQEDLAAMDRIIEVLNMEPDKLDRADAIEAPREVDSVVFNGVSFSYNGTQTKALVNVSFHVRGGQTIALVGKSGAGKSTLTDLLSRFYDPQEGTIHLNGMDLRDLKLQSYRQIIGMVQQDTFLFDGTVRENVAYAVPRACDEEIEAAAQSANAHEFIIGLPNGYDTIIGERGVKLSGGQRQRISIARAFLADPTVLILDEATSHLDTENEQKIQLALKRLLKGRTTFIVAHRLSTVMNADTIIVLEEGRICEIGTHDELTKKGGRYFSMLQRQHSPACI